MKLSAYPVEKDLLLLLYILFYFYSLLLVQMPPSNQKAGTSAAVDPAVAETHKMVEWRSSVVSQARSYADGKDWTDEQKDAFADAFSHMDLPVTEPIFVSSVKQLVLDIASCGSFASFEKKTFPTKDSTYSFCGRELKKSGMSSIWKTSVSNWMLADMTNTLIKKRTKLKDVVNKRTGELLPAYVKDTKGDRKSPPEEKEDSKPDSKPSAQHPPENVRPRSNTMDSLSSLDDTSIASMDDMLTDDDKSNSSVSLRLSTLSSVKQASVSSVKSKDGSAYSRDSVQSKSKYSDETVELLQVIGALLTPPGGLPRRSLKSKISLPLYDVLVTLEPRMKNNKGTKELVLMGAIKTVCGTRGSPVEPCGFNGCQFYCFHKILQVFSGLKTYCYGCPIQQLNITMLPRDNVVTRKDDEGTITPGNYEYFENGIKITRRITQEHIDNGLVVGPRVRSGYSADVVKQKHGYVNFHVGKQQSNLI